MKDNIIDFIEDHKKLCIILGIVVVLIVVMCCIRSSNMKKKAEADALAAQEAATESQLTQIEQDTEEEKKPSNPYKNSLGLDAGKDNDERVNIKEEEEPVTEEPKVPIQTEPTYDTLVTVFDHTEVPKRNMDGSSCKAYQKSVTLNDFGTYWGTSLTEDDFKGGDFYMVGVEQNPDDTLRGDLQSIGWLIDNLDKMNDNDAIKFTNLHVIGDLSQSHVALLCSYDWYSAFGLKDTVVVFEDISNTLNVKDFKDGDIFSATVFRHNIKVVPNVHGQRVIVVQYAVFE